MIVSVVLRLFGGDVSSLMRMGMYEDPKMSHRCERFQIQFKAIKTC